MQKNRKPRSDSISEAVRIGTNLNSVDSFIKWPGIVPAALQDNFRELELSLFDATITCREAARWSNLEVVSVARLSGHIAMQIKDEDTLKRSGTLIRSPNNEKQFIRNPLLDAISTRQAIINQLCRQLGVSVPSVDVNVFNVNRPSNDDNTMQLLAN